MIVIVVVAVVIYKITMHGAITHHSLTNAQTVPEQCP